MQFRWRCAEAWLCNAIAPLAGIGFLVMAFGATTDLRLDVLTVVGFILISTPTIWSGARVPKLKPAKPGVCPQCGYNLTGNTSGICPECGTKCR